MTYKSWLRQQRTNPWFPFKSKRVMRRRIGRWIRRLEKNNPGHRSIFRDDVLARRF